MIRNYKNYNIQQRKDGRYMVVVTDHGHRTYFYGKTKKEVQQKLEVFVAKLNNAAQLQCELNNPTKHMSLKNWAYICLNNYCIASIQGNTYIAYERRIRMHFGELGDMPIGRITNLMVQNHITKLSRLVDENGLSENYLTRLRTFMHMAFEYAVQNNLITHNPANGVRIPKTGIFENRAITQEEADRLIQAVRESDCLVMFSVILCLFTGLRRGEILGLKWCDVDFEKRSISVNKQLVREYNPIVPKEQLLFALYNYRKLDMSVQSDRQKLIDSFVNSIYLYDDHFIITFNYKNTSKKVSLKEINSSSLTSSTPPIKEPPCGVVLLLFGVLTMYIPRCIIA